MEGTGITPVMDMNRGYGYGDGCGFGGSGLWLFAILALMWGGNGLFGNRYAQDGRAATVEDLNNSANFTRLESQVMNNGNRIEQKADAVYSGICNLGYEMANQFSETRAQAAQCCCETQRAIDGVRYDGAINTAALKEASTANTQKILDAIAQNKIEALQARISQLELKEAVAGVVRYPTQYSYNAGQSPFCGGACGCGLAS
nr:MAG TPA: hypothetical protein [Caudoviricetes sp.]